MTKKWLSIKFVSLVLIASLTQNVFAASKMTCFDFEALLDSEYATQIFLTPGNTPIGIWKSETASVRFYLDWKNDRIGAVHSLDNSMMGPTSYNQFVELCVNQNGRTFLKSEENEYTEYYIESGNVLYVADEEFDPEYEDPRSEYDFHYFVRAEVTANK